MAMIQKPEPLSHAQVIVGAAATLLGFALLYVVRGSSGRPDTAAVASGLLFFIPLLVFPRCRLRRDVPISPLNWILFAFFLQLVFLPTLIAVQGPSPGTLPFLPSAASVRRALLVSSVAYVSFCSAYVWLQSHRRSARFARPHPGDPPGVRLIAIFAVVGVLGVFLRYRSPLEFLEYLQDPVSWLSSEGDVTLATGTATFLRPFLLVAIVMLWSRWADLRGEHSSAAARLAATAAAVVGITIVGATYNLNRASIVVPVLALVAAFSRHVRRVTPAALAVAAVIAVGPFLVVGLYRMGTVSREEIVSQPQSRGGLIGDVDLSEQLQVYGTAPQFLAFVIDHVEPLKYRPRALLVWSLLYPVPVLGKRFRPQSAVTLYNEMISGPIDSVDQVVPFEGELYWTGGLLGVAAGFVLLGFLLAWLQAGFDTARGAFQTYSYQYAAIWATFLVVGSLEVVSQIVVYFFWPIFIATAVHALRLRRERRDPSLQLGERLDPAH
jgi:hypothetical protein